MNVTLKIVNYLHVTLNLNDATYKPYKKTKQRNKIYPRRSQTDP